MSGKNVFCHFHILRMCSVHYMTHYSDRRVHSATIWLQQRAIKRDTGSLLFCQPSGCTVHPQLNRWTVKYLSVIYSFWTCLNVAFLQYVLTLLVLFFVSFLMIYCSLCLLIYLSGYLICGKSTIVINLSLHTNNI